MRKHLYVIAALALLGIVAIAKAEYREGAQARNGAPAGIIWTGSEMSIATAGASAQLFNPFDGQGVVQGVSFSSGNCTDFVDIWDSTDTTVVTLASATARIYNVGGSTSPFVAGTICAGQQALQIPLYLQKGLVWKGNVGTYNDIIVHYWEMIP